jgi:hypothetical protein
MFSAIVLDNVRKKPIFNSQHPLFVGLVFFFVCAVSSIAYCISPAWNPHFFRPLRHFVTVHSCPLTMLK